MAAAKPKLPPLDTPLSASFPSEVQSPIPGTSTFNRQAEGQRTPITPPAAYLDFLSKLSPSAGILTPVSATGPGRSPRLFAISEKPALTSQASADSLATSVNSTVTSLSTVSADKSRPPSPRPDPPRLFSFSSSSVRQENDASSRESNGSSSLHQSNGASSLHPSKGAFTLLQSNSASTLHQSNKSTIVFTGPTRMRPPPLTALDRSVPPNSPFARPSSARSPHPHLPSSPFSPASVRSPLSASTLYSPYSAAWSPREPHDPDRDRDSKRVLNVRHVTTRTVVSYSRGSKPVRMDPVPVCRKRKLGEAEATVKLESPADAEAS